MSDDRLIVALDLPSRKSAETLVDRLGDSVSFYKIGYELFYGGDGLAFGKELIAAGKKVFFDLKLFDIENTVKKAWPPSPRPARICSPFMPIPRSWARASRAAAGSGLDILAVTVLTSYDDEDMMNAGYDRDVASLVGVRAHQALLARLGGVVCAPHEAAMVKQLTEGKLKIVTPGIRPAGAAQNEQKRAATPAEALEMGASHLVVGRPITAAPDPAEAARKVVEEMQNGGTRLA